MKAKVRTIDIELAIMKEFNFRQNLIVPNINTMCCEFKVPFNCSNAFR